MMKIIQTVYVISLEMVIVAVERQIPRQAGMGPQWNLTFYPKTAWSLKTEPPVLDGVQDLSENFLPAF